MIFTHMLQMFAYSLVLSLLLDILLKKTVLFIICWVYYRLHFLYSLCHWFIRIANLCISHQITFWLYYFICWYEWKLMSSCNFTSILWNAFCCMWTFSWHISFFFEIKTFINHFVLISLSFNSHQIDKMLRIRFSFQPKLIILHRRLSNNNKNIIYKQ